MNVVCRDRVLYLDGAWNYFRTLAMWPGPIHKTFVERMGESFYVLHFVSELKPWSHPELPLSRYFWKYAKNSVFFERIMKSLGEQPGETNRLKEQNARLQYDLDCVHASVSFRIGRAITWLPRKLRGGIQCYREHGAGYTARRALYHLGLWKDEE